MEPLGREIDALWELREGKRELEEKLTVVAKSIVEKELELLHRMDAEGLLKSTGTHGTVSISESVKPTVTDWDAFYEYIKRHNFMHLLERRPSVTGCRELFELKGKIPGVEPFRQRKVNLRTTEK